MRFKWTSLALGAVLVTAGLVVTSVPGGADTEQVPAAPIVSIGPHADAESPEVFDLNITEDPAELTKFGVADYVFVLDNYSIDATGRRTDRAEDTVPPQARLTYDFTNEDQTIDYYATVILKSTAAPFYLSEVSAPVFLHGPTLSIVSPTPTEPVITVPPPMLPPVLVPPVPKKWVALGDSYSSGEGVPPFLSDSNLKADRCHRSTRSYAEDIVRANSTQYSLSFHACSGALIADMYKPNSTNPGESHPQLDWVTADTDIVTLTIGGDDAYFKQVMTYCASRTILKETCQERYAGQVDYAISQLRRRISNLLQAIKRKAPHAKIYLLGYPRFFPVHPPKNCTTGAGPFAFGQSDMRWINREIMKTDTATSEAAALAGAAYVDTYNLVGAGHDLCSASPWLNRATFPIVYSFHPTYIGQQALGSLLENALG